jgi:hypothetical protein
MADRAYSDQVEGEDDHDRCRRDEQHRTRPRAGLRRGSDAAQHGTQQRVRHELGAQECPQGKNGALPVAELVA